MPAGARSKPHPLRSNPPTVLLAAMLGVSLFPTTLARELPTYKVHAFLPLDLYRESETPEELNPSAVSRMRDQIREVDPRITQLGTVPSWAFPLFAHAALEPNFSPHRDITGVDVPEALSQCIPSLKSPEYRRLIGIRNRVWAAIVREFPEINHWIVGPEPIYYTKGLYSALVDCKGRNLRSFDLIEFIVDTLEELHPAIKQANPCAKVIAYFSYVPFDDDPEIDLPRLIQVEIQHRGNDPKEYYDLLAEQVAPQFEFVPWGGSPVGPLSRRTLYAGLCPFRKWIFDPLRFGAGQSDHLGIAALRIVFRSERKTVGPRLVGRLGGRFGIRPGRRLEDSNGVGTLGRDDNFDEWSRGLGDRFGKNCLRRSRRRGAAFQRFECRRVRRRHQSTRQ